MFAGAEKGAESFMLQEDRRFLSTPGRVRVRATVCVFFYKTFSSLAAFRSGGGLHLC